MSEYQSIDLDHLEKYVAGDNALRDEILEIFAEQLSGLVERVDAEGTDEAWRNTMHAMKGAARGVGAWSLGDLCEEGEALIGNTSGKIERRSGLFVAIKSHADTAMADVKRLRGTG